MVGGRCPLLPEILDQSDKKRPQSLCLLLLTSKLQARCLLVYFCVYICQESMKLMGMKGWIYWTVWYCTFTVFMISSVAIVTAVLHANLSRGREEYEIIKKVGFKPVFMHGASSVTFVFMLLYALSLMTLCFAITTFFSTGTIPDVRHKGINLSTSEHLHCRVKLYILSS